MLSEASKPLQLAISERKKSLEFYKTLQANLHLQMLNAPLESVDSKQSKSAKYEREQSEAEAKCDSFAQDDTINGIDFQILKEFMQCLKEIISKENALLEEIEEKLKDFCVFEKSFNYTNLELENPLPDELLKLATQFENIDSKAIKELYFLLFGIESTQIQTCDFLLKLQCAPFVKDSLFRLQALSYTHHLPLLKNALTNSFEEKKPQNNAQNNLFSNDFLNAQNYSEFLEQNLQGLMEFGTRAREIVTKLQNKELQQKELVEFLEKCNFSLISGGILGSFCAMIASNFYKK
ncbi:hypothetical protein CQA49_04640 [Helicobacter sp. MIT 00-7814]|uniref:hypothetical protein n=1 Tax=unclassified Helicobacter TaxID=2593540 RepID=UPI000E1F3724|nr:MULTISPECIES: hypothetical protein [unclassified Helicobacter]RDU54596.1 hypothetical protein CQA49_04640 [Helicobacter sp. MIT 00-7814]RDU54655.1 hypothetical protein CQA37_05125 [Helicobacter sp. MIT 99-10781]